MPVGKMGPPPREIATRGRANPAGIPYLYTAEQEAIAIAEIRPYVGGKVTICTLRPKKDLLVADLTLVHQISSPFLQTDLKDLIRRNALLNILNRELSRPVNPQASEIEYAPTQYLTEVILNAGYDGIRYESAVIPSGKNIVFFRADKFDFDKTTRMVTVDAVRVEYT